MDDGIDTTIVANYLTFIIKLYGKSEEKIYLVVLDGRPLFSAEGQAF